MRYIFIAKYWMRYLNLISLALALDRSHFFFSPSNLSSLRCVSPSVQFERAMTQLYKHTDATQHICLYLSCLYRRWNNYEFSMALYLLMEISLNCSLVQENYTFRRSSVVKWVDEKYRHYKTYRFKFNEYVSLRFLHYNHRNGVGCL